MNNSPFQLYDIIIRYKNHLLEKYNLDCDMMNVIKGFLQCSPNSSIVIEKLRKSDVSDQTKMKLKRKNSQIIVH